MPLFFDLTYRIPLLKNFFIPVIIVTTCTLVAVWMILHNPQPTEQRSEPPVLLVEVIRARSSSLHVQVKAQGSVTPRTETTLVSEVSGMITEVSPRFSRGWILQKGRCAHTHRRQELSC